MSSPEELESTVSALEKRIDGLVKKNDELLSELKAAQGKPPLTEEQKAERHRALMEQLDKTDRMLGVSKPGAKTDAKPAKIDKVVFDPNEHSASQYQIMKAEADKLGVPFHVLTRAEMSRPGIDQSAVEQFDDTMSGVRYVRRDLLDRYSPIRLHQMAEQDNLKIQIFRTRDELPEDAVALHDAAAKGGD